MGPTLPPTPLLTTYALWQTSTCLNRVCAVMSLHAVGRLALLVLPNRTLST